MGDILPLIDKKCLHSSIITLHIISITCAFFLFSLWTLWSLNFTCCSVVCFVIFIFFVKENRNVVNVSDSTISSFFLVGALKVILF